MMEAMPDEHTYADPANQEVAGPGTRRKRPGLSTHVPIRFSPEIIAAVRSLADSDGISVSTWIRNVVMREVKRRQPPQTGSMAFLELKITSADAGQSRSGSSSLQPATLSA